MMVAENKAKWEVAHTRPRCEKKLATYCQRHSLHCDLPCYDSIRKYRSKQVTFKKPLFPGYVFIKAPSASRRLLLQSDYVANLLEVTDQGQFIRQLEEIHEALGSGLDIQLAPVIGKGCRVLIKSGPLQGIEGWVEERYGMNMVLLRLDFIGQAAAVKIDAENLELI
jgi:transcription antitermination factor NusG